MHRFYLLVVTWLRYSCFTSALLQNLAKHLLFVFPIVEFYILNSIRYYCNGYYFCKGSKIIHTNKQNRIKNFHFVLHG